MNRLKQYLDNEEPLMPEGDYWVIETRSAYLFVSADTARAIERALTRLWRPRWLVFRDLTGGRRRLQTNVVECIYESTAKQREVRRAFDRDRRREEEKADRRPWEDDN
jgi:hypothetical protein